MRAHSRPQFRRERELALQWQQMLTNQLNQLIHTQAQGLVRIYALNTHGMKPNEIQAVVPAINLGATEQAREVTITVINQALQFQALGATNSVSVPRGKPRSARLAGFMHGTAFAKVNGR